jgi:predicted molibdopterin-dependent oxidoreductase YjgC
MSQFGEGTVAVCADPYVELSREDAAALKIADNDQVKVTSAQGTVTVTARVSNRMQQGVVFAPYHFSAAPVQGLSTGSAVTAVTIAK